MKKIVFLLAIAVTFTFMSCDKDDDKAETIIVASKMYSYYGWHNTNCYLIKHNAGDEWTRWYDRIDGFEHQEGYEYVLNVVKKKNDPRLMDTGTHYYVLVSIVSSVEKESENLPPVIEVPQPEN